MQVIQGRRGERIVVDEYPAGFADELNARLNGIPAGAAEVQAAPDRLTEAADALLDVVVDKGTRWLLWGTAALAAVVVGAQTAIWLVTR